MVRSDYVREKVRQLPIMEVEHLQKSFGSLEVLKDISFSVSKNDVIAIIGPSGSGKSTMLRSLINLEQADGGTIKVDGEYLIKEGQFSSSQTIKNVTGKMGMVFQHFNLFPHLSVRQNLELAPKLTTDISKSDLSERTNTLLEKVGLSDKLHDYPGRLSGGQQQRVAIARALMLQPQILLFDEPTSALDPELTGEVLKVIRELAEESMTMLVVTHEMDFAKQVANKIIFMDEGKIIEAGDPVSVLEQSKRDRTKRFISGLTN